MKSAGCTENEKALPLCEGVLCNVWRACKMFQCHGKRTASIAFTGGVSVGSDSRNHCERTVGIATFK